MVVVHQCTSSVVQSSHPIAPVPYDQVSFSDLTVTPALELSRYKLVNQ